MLLSLFFFLEGAAFPPLLLNGLFLLRGVALPPSLGGVACFLLLFAWCCRPLPPSLGGAPFFLHPPPDQKVHLTGGGGGGGGERGLEVVVGVGGVVVVVVVHVANLNQPQGEEKDCEARPPHPPLLRRKGSAIFSVSLALDAQDPE